MPCGCGKRPETASAVGLRQAVASIDGGGEMYTLASQPGCERPYRGQFQGAKVYIVGYGTENETIYRRGDRTLAARQARQLGTTLTPFLAVDLCEDAMVQVLGA